MVLITARKVIAFFTLVLLPGNALASVQAVWAVNDGEKIERDDLNNSNKSSNSAWDGRKVKVFGARNEIIAFHDIHPWAPVHILLIPKQHIESMVDVTEADAALLGRMMAISPRLLRDLGPLTPARMEGHGVARFHRLARLVLEQVFIEGCDAAGRSDSLGRHPFVCGRDPERLGGVFQRERNRLVCWH